jgi:hypothetical protein
MTKNLNAEISTAAAPIQPIARHNPFRKRTKSDKLCIWFLINGRPSRRYCTNTFRTNEGALGLERTVGKSKIATAAHAAIIDQVLHIEVLK